MGYYKDHFTPWGAISSYEDDELAEMDKLFDPASGVLRRQTPQLQTKVYNQSPSHNGYSYGKTTCHYCGAPTSFRPGKPFQECKKCRHESMMRYLDAVSKKG